MDKLTDRGWVLCETCGGQWTHNALSMHGPCPCGGGLGEHVCLDCVEGLVPSEGIIDAAADGVADLHYDTLELRNWGDESVADPYRIVARAALIAAARKGSGGMPA